MGRVILRALTLELGSHLPFLSCVTFSRILNLSEPQISHF